MPPVYVLIDPGVSGPDGLCGVFKHPSGAILEARSRTPGDVVLEFVHVGDGTVRGRDRHTGNVWWYVRRF